MLPWWRQLKISLIIPTHLHNPKQKHRTMYYTLETRTEIHFWSNQKSSRGHSHHWNIRPIVFSMLVFIYAHILVYAATKPNNFATFCGENCPFYNCSPIKTFWCGKLVVSFAIFGYISSFVLNFPLIYFRCDMNCLHELTVNVVT